MIECLQYGYVDDCDEQRAWFKFNGCDWSWLLRNDSGFIDRCDEYNGWAKMNGVNWAALLSLLPELASRCNWDELDASNWRMLLLEQPQFAEKCDKWDKMSAEDRDLLTEMRPELFSFFNGSGEIFKDR
jgi:hypothetical protein